MGRRKVRTGMLGILLPLAACGGAEDAAAPVPDGFRRDSGGALSPEQAAYDVRRYELDLSLDPERRRIDGSATVHATLVAPLERFVLDLDPLLAVSAVREAGGEARAFRHEGGRLQVELGGTRAAGETVVLTVDYGGRPRVAPKPPWEGGFQWERTPSGDPWIATSCQMDGADLWWPCKDHPSDEPDSFGIAVRVPEPLVCASNGALQEVREHGDGTRTFVWEVSTPISNYSVALNVAPYRVAEERYESVAGDVFPLKFWYLPSREEDALAFVPEVLEHLRWFEEHFGPYPFRADKYGLAETPHLGMEHQTIIAYGYAYRQDEFGYDDLHHHELAHEWFANLVTAADWKDFWIHEGIATYAQKLYVEDLRGIEAYHRAMADSRAGILNRKPLAPREPRTAAEMYFRDPGAPAGSKPSDSDIYRKGACVLHTLRWLMGREELVGALRRLCYPDPALERSTDGSACRFVDTEDVRALFEEAYGGDLGWFFEVYLRQPALPRLVAEQDDGLLRLRWETPGGLPFPMPVEVEVEGARRRVAVPAEGATLQLPDGAAARVDPDDWVLKRR